ncbi:hypothetical protein CVT24_005822 [Panaeolus cyanescens]|uniref:Uncharacterized protein n=1 Tax=Panaeolus cyanescens TaxID=181874 RepID=A0A409V903_9AGAR|nr:hypothetical protein CVT24_005822 [Panaeolus cyanescens]
MAGDNNVAVSSAIHVLDSLADVGKALPFVAPAFIILKVIIDIEQRAQEVDIKCSDLLERITFMVSHLPILEKMEIMPGTQKVIDRMVEAMKGAASLIAAYRKQSKIARRLSISNRDKFVQCADAVNNCCQDLLMSLQIYQTGQLEILTRAVPVDEEDIAAQTFVDEHGGSIDAFIHDRELVKEFADQQKFSMDDSVMDQLNANIAETVNQNHQRLEGIIKENVSSAVVDGLKSLVASLNAVESEQTFNCIQCDQPFTNSTNGPTSCSFHRADYDSWSRSFPCCSTNHPCQFQAHRAKHHCDYPYANFFPRARNVTGYTDTNEEWASVEDTNLETDESQKAFIGQLYRWKTRGARLEENTLLITVGRVWYKYPYYFNTFTAKELEDISKSVRVSRRTLIFRTTKEPEEFAMAEWILSVSGKITGVRLTAKTTTSSNPWIRICPIDISTCTKSGDILTPSEGGMRSYTPASPYVLPATVRMGPELSDQQTRPVRTNFKTRSSPSLRVILKAASDPPLEANPNLASTTVDYFIGTVSVFNNNAPGSNVPVTIAGISAAFRLIGDKTYAPVESCKLTDMSPSFPVTIDPRQACQLSFQVAVPRTKEDADQRITWWNRAFCARKQPVRIKVTLEDIEGEEASLVFEYVFKPFPLKKEDPEKHLGFFFFDNPDTSDRHVVEVEKPWSEGETVLRISSQDITVKRLVKAVYQALKTGKTEIDLEIGQEKNDGEWEWAAYALVDISCRRVYAFKIIVKEGNKVPVKRFGCLGYVLCPSYGEVVAQGKTRPISYATEKEKLPPIEPYQMPEYPQEDSVDDYKPPVPPKPSTPLLEIPPALGAAPNGTTTGGGMVMLPPEVTSRLASIDATLLRIAEALERLAPPRS